MLIFTIELFEACSKNTPSMLYEILRRYQKGKLINRFRKEYSRRETLEQHGIINNSDDDFLNNSIPFIEGIKLTIEEKNREICQVCKRTIMSTINLQEVKLECGHIYHMNCLRKRLPHRQTCYVESCRFVFICLIICVSWFNLSMAFC